MKGKNICTVFLVFAGLLLFSAQSVWSVGFITPTNAHNNADAGIGVIIDVRTVDEHNGLAPPWVNPGVPDTTLPAGTAVWNVTGTIRMPPLVPFWTDAVPSDPTQVQYPANFTEIVEALLAAGVIDFDTPLYLICRSGYRSYYAGVFLETNTFYNARTGQTGSFTQVFSIDVDNNPTDGDGGMVAWNTFDHPIYSDFTGETTMPPQVYSITPVDGYIETGSNDVTFEIGILQPTPAYFTYPAVSRVSLYINGAEADFSTSDTTGLWTVYRFTQNLPNGDYTWNSRAEDAGARVSWNPYAFGSNVGNRALTVAAPPPDTTPPAVTINSPVDGATYTTATVDIEVTVTDDESGVASVIARIDGTTDVTLTQTATNTYTGTTPELADGVHTLQIIATDNAGNVNDTASVSFTVAVALPEFPVGAAMVFAAGLGSYLWLRRRYGR